MTQSFDFAALVARAIAAGETDSEAEVSSRCADLAAEILDTCKRFRNDRGLRLAEALHVLARVAGNTIRSTAKKNPDVALSFSLEIANQVLMYATESTEP